MTPDQRRVLAVVATNKLLHGQETVKSDVYFMSLSSARQHLDSLVALGLVAVRRSPGYVDGYDVSGGAGENLYAPTIEGLVALWQ